MQNLSFVPFLRTGLISVLVWLSSVYGYTLDSAPCFSVFLSDELRKLLTTNVCNRKQLKYRPQEICNQHAVTSTDYVCACSTKLGSFYSILTHDAVDDRWLLGNEDILTVAFVQYTWKRDG